MVVPLYNGGPYIESTLTSILGQSYRDYEILVVDDGSTDDGLLKVTMLSKTYPDRIRIFHHPDGGNHGIAASRNLGIKNAHGSLIAFIDQDDLWLPEKLARQVESLQRFPEAGMVYARASFIDQEGREKPLRGIHHAFGKGVPGKPHNMFRNLLMEDFVPNLTVLVRKSCLERVGLHDEGPLYEFEDWLLWSKVAFFYKVTFIPEVLANWRIHDSNYSAKIFEMAKFSHAEEHCTIALFSFLMKESNVRTKELRKYLRRRIWRLFLRARSWGVSKQTIDEHALNLVKAFPTERRTIDTAVRTARLLHPKVGSALRRMHRSIVGV